MSTSRLRIVTSCFAAGALALSLGAAARGQTAQAPAAPGAGWEVLVPGSFAIAPGERVDETTYAFAGSSFRAVGNASNHPTLASYTLRQEVLSGSTVVATRTSTVSGGTYGYSPFSSGNTTVPGPGTYTYRLTAISSTNAVLDTSSVIVVAENDPDALESSDPSQACNPPDCVRHASQQSFYTETLNLVAGKAAVRTITIPAPPTTVSADSIHRVQLQINATQWNKEATGKIYLSAPTTDAPVRPDLHYYDRAVPPILDVPPRVKPQVSTERRYDVGVNGYAVKLYVTAKTAGAVTVELATGYYELEISTADEQEIQDDLQADLDATYTDEELQDFLARSQAQLDARVPGAPVCATSPTGSQGCLTEQGAGTPAAGVAPLAAAQCEGPPFSTTGGWFLTSRYGACRISLYDIPIYRSNNDIWTSHRVAVQQFLYLSDKIGRVSTRTRFFHVNGSPFRPDLPGIVWTQSCSGNLECPSRSGVTEALDEGEASAWIDTSTSVVNLPSTGSRLRVNTGYRFTFKGTQNEGSDDGVGPTGLLDLPTVRCDNSDQMKSFGLRTTGCVADGYAPVFDIMDVALTTERKDRVRPVTRHMADALASGYPGRIFTADPVTRDSTADRVRANFRAKERRCRALRPGQDDEQCDEYPFSKTVQGCASATGCSVRWVPQPANSLQGGLIAKFFKIARVLNDDRFYVVARPDA